MAETEAKQYVEQKFEDYFDVPDEALGKKSEGEEAEEAAKARAAGEGNEEPEEPEAPKAKEQTKESGGEAGESGEEKELGGKFVFDDESGAGEAGETKPETPAQKTFEEMLLEKTEGKYNSLDDLIKKIDEPKKPTYKQELATKFDEFISGGGDPKVFAQFLAIDVSTIKDDIEALVLRDKWENPSLDEASLREAYKIEYGLFDDDDPDYDERKALVGKTKMAREAATARKELNVLQDGFRNPEAEKPMDETAKREAEENEHKRIDLWENALPNIIEGKKTIKIKLDKGVFEYELNIDKKGAMESLKNIVANTPGILPNREGMEMIGQVLESAEFNRNKQGIVMAAMNQGRNLTNEQWQKIRNNPSSATAGGGKAIAPADKNVDDIIDDALVAKFMPSFKKR